MPLSVALTVDVDPDANRPARGRPDAVSPCGEAAFCACFEGMEVLASIVEESGVPVALFWEARTLARLAGSKEELLDRLMQLSGLENGCHGLRHEDFAGNRTGLPLNRENVQILLQQAEGVFRSVLGEAPQGFRAPYCRLTDELAEGLTAAGYRYDASRTHELSHDCVLAPYQLETGDLWEVPLCRARDSRGSTVSAYLWQLCEGNRTWRDYADLLDAARRRCPHGLVQFALHPWHLVVNADGEPHDDDRRRAIADGIAQLLEHVTGDEALQFTTPGAYLAAR